MTNPYFEPDRTCARCTDPGVYEVGDRWYCTDCKPEPTTEDHLLEALKQERAAYVRLRETFSRIVDAVWDEIGEERMIRLIGGTNWAQHHRRTIEQIRNLDEAA